MGPYCSFCDHRCFVPNPRNSNPFTGPTILATCPKGKAHDLRSLGYNFDTAKDAKPD